MIINALKESKLLTTILGMVWLNNKWHYYSGSAMSVFFPLDFSET